MLISECADQPRAMCGGNGCGIHLKKEGRKEELRLKKGYIPEYLQQSYIKRIQEAC